MTQWRIVLTSNPLEKPKFDHKVINPFTGQPDILVEYEELTLEGEIVAEIEFPTNPSQDPSATITFENKIRIPMVVTKWTVRRI